MDRLGETVTLNGTRVSRLYAGDFIPWVLQEGDVLTGQDWMFVVSKPGIYRSMIRPSKVMRVGVLS